MYLYLTHAQHDSIFLSGWVHWIPAAFSFDEQRPMCLRSTDRSGKDRRGRLCPIHFRVQPLLMHDGQPHWRVYRGRANVCSKCNLSTRVPCLVCQRGRMGQTQANALLIDASFSVSARPDECGTLVTRPGNS